MATAMVSSRRHLRVHLGGRKNESVTRDFWLNADILPPRPLTDLARSGCVLQGWGAAGKQIVTPCLAPSSLPFGHCTFLLVPSGFLHSC